MLEIEDESLSYNHMGLLLTLLLLWNDKFPEDVGSGFGWGGVITVLIIIIGGEITAKQDKKNKGR